VSKYSELLVKYPLKGNFNLGTVPELQWILDNIRYNGRVIDVGCQESRLADFLVDYYDDVWGIDINEKSCWGDFSDRKFTFVVGDIRNYAFNTTFDDVIFMSSLEHMGLEAYHNTWVDSGGDRQALISARRLISDNGLIYVTVPYGDWSAGRSRWGDNWMRVYTEETLNNLLSGFKVVRKELVDNNQRACLVVS